jgi:hypothetical protein
MVKDEQSSGEVDFFLSRQEESKKSSVTLTLREILLAQPLNPLVRPTLRVEEKWTP